jgi:hypothetical protein
MSHLPKLNPDSAIPGESHNENLPYDPNSMLQAIYRHVKKKPYFFLMRSCDKLLISCDLFGL